MDAVPDQSYLLQTWRGRVDPFCEATMTQDCFFCSVVFTPLSRGSRIARGAFHSLRDSLTAACPEPEDLLRLKI